MRWVLFYETGVILPSSLTDILLPPDVFFITPVSFNGCDVEAGFMILRRVDMAFNILEREGVLPPL